MDAGMEITLNTPALLFPAMSLILLAYNNRFMTLASLIRNLHTRWAAEKNDHIAGQIANLRLRLRLVRDMQAIGISAMFGCVLCMFLVYRQYQEAAIFVFGISLLLLLISLSLSLWEIYISTRALNLELRDMEGEIPGVSLLRSRKNPTANQAGTLAKATTKTKE